MPQAQDKTAILEIAMSLVGLNSTSWGLDSDSLNKELGHQVLSILAAPRHNRHIRILKKLFDHFLAFEGKPYHSSSSICRSDKRMIFNTVIDATTGVVLLKHDSTASRITSEHAASYSILSK